MKIVTVPLKHCDPKKWLLVFFGKETHSETKSWKSSRILTNKVTTNNGKPSRIFRVNPNFLSFHHFFHIFSFFFNFFDFFIFSIFSFFDFFHVFRFFRFFFNFSCFNGRIHTPRTAPVGSHRSSAQFALWIHANIINRRLKHSVDKLVLRHHPHVQRGLLELNLHDHRDVHHRGNRPTTTRCSLSRLQAAATAPARRLPATASWRRNRTHLRVHRPAKKHLSVMRRWRRRAARRPGRCNNLTSIALYRGAHPQR